MIDNGADQPVINERVAGLIERLTQVGTDHEKRIRYLERIVTWAMGGMGVMSTGLLLWSKLK